MKLPNFLVIGPPRTGTTWLFRNINRHPQIYVPSVKQIHFFDQHFDNGLAWYGSMFNGAPNSATAIGDITPNYFAYPQAPERIYKTFGNNVRLFVIYRHPVERALSEYRMKRRSGGTDQGFLESLNADELLRENSLYAENYRRFQQYFSHDNLHVLSYEQLSQDPSAFLRSFFNTLSVDPDYSPDKVAELVGGSQPPAKWLQLNRAAVGIKSRVEAFPLGRRFMWAMREQGLVRLWHRVNSKDQGDGVTEDEWAKAMSYFEADHEEFAAIRSNPKLAAPTKPVCSTP